jgi:hypothetical protein
LGTLIVDDAFDADVAAADSGGSIRLTILRPHRFGQSNDIVIRLTPGQAMLLSERLNAYAAVLSRALAKARDG